MRSVVEQLGGADVVTGPEHELVAIGGRGAHVALDDPDELAGAARGAVDHRAGPQVEQVAVTGEAGEGVASQVAQQADAGEREACVGGEVTVSHGRRSCVVGLPAAFPGAAARFFVLRGAPCDTAPHERFG